MLFLSIAGALILVGGVAAGFAITGRPLPFLDEDDDVATSTTIRVAVPVVATTTTPVVAEAATTAVPPTTTTTERSATGDVIATALAADGWFRQEGAEVTDDVLRGAVEAVASEGEDLRIAALAEERHTSRLADRVWDKLGEGLVLVVTPSGLGVSGTLSAFDEDELLAMFQAAQRRHDGEERIASFVDSLTAATVPGDLGLAQPMNRPPCDGRYVVFYGAAVDVDTYEEDVTSYLDLYPDSQYLRTDVMGCSSLRRRDGSDQVIYAVYLGPYSTLESACEDLADVDPFYDPYVKPLDNISDPSKGVPCT